MSDNVLTREYVFKTKESSHSLHRVTGKVHGLASVAMVICVVEHTKARQNVPLTSGEIRGGI